MVGRRDLSIVASLAFALGACDALLGIESLRVEGDGSIPSATEEDAAVPTGDAEELRDAPPPAHDVDAACVEKATAPATPAIVTASGAGNAWTSPNAVMYEDGVSAIAEGCCGSDDSRLLTLQGFDLAVPASAEIRGVKVEIRLRQASGIVGGAMNDRSVKLTVTTDPGTGEDLKSATPYPAVFETRSYGGPTSLWGLPLTPERVSSAAFGVVFRTGHVANVNAAAAVDVVRVTVFYCE